MQKWQSNQEIISKSEHSIYNYFRFIGRSILDALHCVQYIWTNVFWYVLHILG